MPFFNRAVAAVKFAVLPSTGRVFFPPRTTMAILSTGRVDYKQNISTWTQLKIEAEMQNMNNVHCG